MIVSDTGTELTSNAVLAWSGDADGEWHYVAPGKPTQNGPSRASTVGCVSKLVEDLWREEQGVSMLVH